MAYIHLKMPNIGVIGTICWWFCQWLIQNKIQNSATQQENKRWDDKLMTFFFSLRILFDTFSKCFLIIFLCFEVAKHLCEWPEILLSSFHGLTRPLKEVAVRLTPKEHNRQVGPSLLIWQKVSSFWVHFVTMRWLRTAAVSLRISLNGFCVLP